MRRLIVVAMAVSSLASSALAEDCNNVLVNSVYTVLSKEKTVDLTLSYKELFKHTYKQVVAKSRSAGGEYKFISANYDEREYEELRTLYLNQKTIDLTAEISERIVRKQQLKGGDPVKAWTDCIARRPIRSSGSDGCTTFKVDVTYLPRLRHPKDVGIINVVALGAKQISGELQKGLRLGDEATASATFKRDASYCGAISVWVDIEGFGTERIPIVCRRKKEPKTVTKTITAFGGWPKVNGDCEMGTEGQDQVPVEVKSTIVTEAERIVYVDVFFRCTETSGDHSTFEGTRRFEVYTAPKGWRILSMSGTLNSSVSETSVGKNHNVTKFKDSGGTHWNTVSYRIDHGGQDCDIVGMRGELKIAVVLEQLCVGS